MNPFIEDYLERLSALHRGCVQAIQGLSNEALDWVPVQIPTAEMNSINVLVTHIIGAERYWIGDVALGDISGRVREREFQVRGMNAEELVGKIDAATDYACSMLEKFETEDLIKKVESPRDRQVFSVAWALLHTLEHTAIHLGHIQLTRQLWNEHIAKLDL